MQRRVGTAHRIEKAGVVQNVIALSLPKMPAWISGDQCRKGDRVEFVVAHDDAGRTGLDHAPYNRNGLELGGPTVDQIADKDHAAILAMSPGTVSLFIIKAAEQCLQGIRVTVYITNNIEAHSMLIISASSPSCDGQERRRT
jgi:hypothetical protein